MHILDLFFRVFSIEECLLLLIVQLSKLSLTFFTILCETFLWFLNNLQLPYRMIADPSFIYKLLLEQAATLGCSVWWELKNRKGRY